MNIKVIAVGKLREEGFKIAFAEFAKRLTPYCTFSCYEIPAESIKDNALTEKYKGEEAQKILSQIKPHSCVITLEISGKSFSSEDFAQKIREISSQGTGEIVFIIGGANGLAANVSARADFKMSFSKMTFPHQLARVMLAEQIYRAMKIISNEPYHK